MKMYITQLRGVFEQISQENDDQLEEAGRRLAQSIASQGKIVILSVGNHTHIIREAMESANALPKTITFDQLDSEGLELQAIDTLFLFVSKGKSDEALKYLDSLGSTDVQVIGILTKDDDIPKALSDRLDTSLFVPQSGPLIPFNDSDKIGNPESLAELYLYHLIYFSVMEILDEQELLEMD